MNLHRPSPAIVVAFVALLLALSSPAWGAAAKQLITGKQIASNAISSSKVKDGTLLAKDFKKGQLPAGARGATGATGGPGAPGPKGDTGAAGAKGAKGDQGVPGPTVAGGAQGSSSSTGPVGAASGLVNLASSTDSTGQVVLPWAGRILVNGMADLVNPTVGPAAARVRCQLFISDGTGPTSGLSGFGPLAFGDTSATSNEHVVVPVTGFVSKPAGTYNIVLRCENVTASVSSYSAGFTYTAVPTS